MKLFSSPPEITDFLQAWQADLGEFTNALAWSPDGTRLAAAPSEGPALIWNARGELIYQCPAHRQGTDAIAWRHDSNILATGGQDGKIGWHNPEAKSSEFRPAGGPWVEHLAWNRPSQPGGSFGLLASSAGKKLQVWNHDGSETTNFPDHPSTISALGWQTGKNIVYTGTFGGVALWAAGEAKLRDTFDYKNPILALAFSPDGRWLVTGNQDASVHVWEVKSKEELHMRGFATKVRELSWHPGGKFLATGGGDLVSIWDCSGAGPNGRSPKQLEWHEANLVGVAYQVKGTLLASLDEEGGLAIWHPETTSKPLISLHLPEPGAQLTWSPDGESLAVGGGDGGVRVFSCKVKAA